jgi:hypothetical protein
VLQFLYGKEEGKSGIESVTRNQRFALRWLTDNCSASGVVRVSAWELGLNLGWSRQYARQILNALVDDDYLSVLRQGTGHGATKFRVLSLSETKQRLVTTNTLESGRRRVPSDNIKDLLYLVKSKPLGITREGDSARRHYRDRIQNIFDNVAIRVKKPVQVKNTPFKRFQEHCDIPEVWKSTDFVCYFSFVHKVRWGEMPKLEWAKECGAARTLLRRIGDPYAFKAFIQVAFYISKRRPKGLYSFSFGDFYEEVIDREVTDEILDEYDDECVFPWLWEKVKREGIAASVEYNARLTRRAFGIYD